MAADIFTGDFFFGGGGGGGGAERESWGREIVCVDDDLCVTCKRETEGYVTQIRICTFVMFHVSKQPHIVPLMCILEGFSA